MCQGIISSEYQAVRLATAIHSCHLNPLDVLDDIKIPREKSAAALCIGAQDGVLLKVKQNRLLAPCHPRAKGRTVPSCHAHRCKLSPCLLLAIFSTLIEEKSWVFAFVLLVERRSAFLRLLLFSDFF